MLHKAHSTDMHHNRKIEMFSYSNDTLISSDAIIEVFDDQVLADLLGIQIILSNIFIIYKIDIITIITIISIMNL